MKNITFLLFLFTGLAVFAQNVTLTQNLDPNNVTDSGVVCRVNAAEEDVDEGLFEGMYFDNYFARAFDFENDHGITEDFTISSIEVGQGFGRNIQIQVNIYTANTDDLSDPSLDMQLLETENVFIITQGDETVLFVPTSVLIPAGEIVVVEIFGPSSGDATDEEFFMGINDAGQTKTAYIKAPDCSVNSYLDSSLLGVGSQDYIINITGQETLSIDQAKLNEIELYPNPVSNQINLELPAGLILERASISDMNGRQFSAKFVDGVLDASELATGQYILTLQTSGGNHVHKFLKK